MDQGGTSRTRFAYVESNFSCSSARFVVTCIHRTHYV